MKKGKWYTKVSNWLFVIVCVVLGLILLGNLAIMYQANTNKDKVPSIFGYKPFMVLSGSMESEIRKGDLIITKLVDPETLKVDDVIAFRDAQNTVTTHRIIDIVERDGEVYFVTKGDNNASQDRNLVTLDDVEGIYITRIPGVGNMLNGLAEPTTIVIVVLGITVIFACSFLISNKKQVSQEQLEFMEYKRQKELEKAKEDEEFLEFKRQKELKEKEASSAKTPKEKKDNSKYSKGEKETTDRN